MNFGNVLKKELMVFNLDSTTKEEAIRELSKLLLEHNVINNEDQYIQAVLDRENHSTTGVGNGIAIPHGKSSSVDKTSIVFAKSKQPIEWDSLDGKPVDIIFLLAIKGEDQGDTHLKILSEIAMKLMDDDVVQNLKQAVQPEAVIEILEKGEVLQ